MEYNKQPIDLSQQIETLKARGMRIDNEVMALNQLGSISYFRLANYWKSMEVKPASHIFSPNSRFEDVIELYLFLESWIKNASVLRNCCAHHARLWNRRFPIAPKLPQSLPMPWLSYVDVLPVKLYAHLCYLAYMDMSINPNSNFRIKILELISTKLYSTLRAMGFPSNWQDEPLWQP